MSFPVERLRNHLDAGSLLTGYTIKYDYWTDADLQSADSFAVFRLAGTGGDSAFDIQQPDVRVIFVGLPENNFNLRTAAWDCLKYLRDNYSDTESWLYEPIGFPQGPMVMSDGRHVWEITVRVGVEDH